MEQFNMFEGVEVFGFTNNTPVKDLFVKDETRRSNSTKGRSLSELEEKVLDPSHFLYTKKHECPICSNGFECTMVRSSRIRFIRSDTDLRSYYEPYDPIYYDIVVCTKCGYTSTNTLFKRVTEKQAELISTKISPTFKNKDYSMVYSVDDAIERYKLALMNSAVKNGKNSEKGMLCLKLAWLMRDKKEEEKELFFIKNAIIGLTVAYEKENLPIFGMDENTLSYLIAELHRRTKNYTESMKYLSRVIFSKNVSKRLKDRAIDIRDLIKAEYNKSKS